MLHSLRLKENPAVHVFSLIFLCFLLTSVGYLSWLYHLMDLMPVSHQIELVTEVFGYICQAAGLCLFGLCVRCHPKFVTRTGFILVVVFYILFLIPAALCESLTMTLLCGNLMNLFCGLIAGYYLHQLALGVNETHRATVFGLGYGVSSIVLWLLTLPGDISRSNYTLILCAVLAILAICFFTPELLSHCEYITDSDQRNVQELTGGLTALAFLTIILLSLVKNLGFEFPTADLSAGISLELSRVCYGVGLAIAGFISDKSRKYGAVFCLAALVIPFIMLTLRGETISSMALWNLNYFFFGFFSVFRVIFFSDITIRSGLLWLSGLGLLSGRLGDAAGTYIYLSLDRRTSALVIVAATLFILTVFLFFYLFQNFYAPTMISKKTDQERFEAFAIRYQFSQRERDVLRLILREQFNAEIAAELFVSESTVKFHVHNLLKKTGCKNRIELMALYHSE